MNKTDHVTTAPASSRGHSGARSSRPVWARWGLLLALLAAGALLLFAGPDISGGSWSTGGMGLLLLLFLLPCLLMPFMMGRGHGGKSEGSNVDGKGGQ